MAVVVRLIALHAHLVRIPEIAHFGRHIFGYVNEDRPGPSRFRYVKGLFDDARHLFHVSHEIAVLGARARNADDVCLLKGIVADEGGIHLSRENHDRYGIHVGRGDPCHRVRGSRTGCDQTNAGPARGPRITVGRMHRRLLVAHQNLLQVRAVQGVCYIEDSASRVAKKRVHTLQFK